VVVECYKCGEKEHKCRECPLWEKRVKEVVCPIEEKVHQGERRKLAYLERGKVQECIKRKQLRRTEKGEVVCPAKGEAIRGYSRVA